SGGLVLSGDDLTKIPPKRLAMLKKLLPPTARAAAFDDETLRVGAVEQKDGRVVCLFNFEDKPQTIEAKLPGTFQVSDFWTGVSLGRKTGALKVEAVPAHGARLLLCRPVPA